MEKNNGSTIPEVLLRWLNLAVSLKIEANHNGGHPWPHYTTTVAFLLGELQSEILL